MALKIASSDGQIQLARQTLAELRDAALKWATPRLPVLVATALCLGMLACLRFMPLELYWEITFRDLNGYLWWPGAVALVIAIFPIAGWLYHRRSGTSIYAPLLAAVALAAILTLLLFIVASWVADRSRLWCQVTVAILLACDMALAIGVIGYGELWRALCNRFVVKRVESAIVDGSFRRYAFSSPRWSSPHCLLIVDAHYTAVKERILRTLTDNRPPSSVVLATFLESAWALVVYLQLPSAGTPGTAAQRYFRRVQVIREAATVWIWAERLQPNQVVVDRGLIRTFLDDASGNPGVESRSFIEFLREVFNMTVTSDVASVVTAVLMHHDSLRDGSWTHDGGTLDMRAVARDTWLAVASGLIDDQVTVDAWIAMHRPDESLVSVRTNVEYVDPVTERAHLERGRLYERWADRTPAPWNDALKVQAQAMARLSTAVRPRRRVAADAPSPATTSSWTYLWVWRTPAVQACVLALTLLLAVPCVAVLAASAPAMIGNWGWNTIDAVDEYNPVQDYRRLATRAMAASGRTLALATSEGLTLMDIPSRVMSRYNPGHGAADITLTRSDDPEGRFLLLNEDQSLTLHHPQRMFELSTLLPAPATPFWSGASAAAVGKLLVTQLDDAGWLLALRGIGIARYERGPGNIPTRTWQTSALSNIDLTDARATPIGVWLRTRSSVAFADRKSLAPVASRALDRGVQLFDASGDGMWALAREGGSLYGFDERIDAWAGPYFASGSNVTAASDISVARIGTDAWLGGHRGLQRYDAEARVLRQMDASDVRSIELVGHDALVATANGLKRFSGDGSTSAIDSGAISSLGLSSDSAAATWIRQEATGREVRFGLTDRLDDVITLVGDSGWKAGATPNMIGVYPIGGSRALFVTDRGSFFYVGSEHRYADASQSVVRVSAGGEVKETVETLSTFSQVTHAGSVVVGIADGKPQRISFDDAQWTNLDPLRQTQPVDIALTQDRVFGLGRRGEIHTYWPSRSDVLTDASAILSSRAPTQNDFSGDIVRIGNRSVIALLHFGTVVTYDTATGNLQDEARSFLGQDPRQVRLLSDGSLVYVSQMGSVLDRDHMERFGRGALPFVLADVTAIAPGTTPDSVVVAGPAGYVGSYDSPSGSWMAMARLHDSPVTSLERIGDGLLAVQASGRASYLVNGAWTALPSFRALTAAGAQIVTIDNGGAVIRFDPRETTPGQLSATRFSEAGGMRAFVAQSVFAWKRDANVTVFFNRNGVYGEYSAATDSFRMVPGNYGEPLQFVRVAGGLAVLFRSGLLVHFTSSLDGKRLEQASGGSPHIWSDGRVLRMVYAANGSLHVSEWSGTGLEAHLTHERGGRPPVGENRPTPLEGSFADDLYFDVGIDTRGEIWALRPDALVRVQLREKSLQVLHPGLEVPVAREIASLLNVPQVARLGLRRTSVASRATALVLDGHSLTFSHDRDGQLDSRWESSSGQSMLPKWGTCGGLASQCVHDVALAAAEDLLVVTELGLFVRNARTYAVRAFYPQLARARLTVTSHPRRVFVSGVGGSTLEWHAGALQPTSNDPQSLHEQINVDGVRWEMRRTGGLTVRTARGAPRRMIGVGQSGYKFATDFVRWIGRDGTGACVVTDDAAWKTDASFERTAMHCLPDQKERNAITLPALRVLSESGRVTLVPFDGAGLPAIVSGRLFFDNASQFEVTAGALYTLVPGRALLERDPERPAEIRRVWKPPVAQAAALEVTGNTVRMLAQSAGSPLEAYDLDIEQNTWKRRTMAATPGIVTIGSIEWRTDVTTQSRFTPFAVGDRLSVARWWEGDRFAWDQIRGVAALSRDVIVLATAAGPIVGRVSNNQLDWLQWLPNRSVSNVGTARVAGQVRGVVVTGGDGSQLLVSDRDGRIRISEHRGHSLSERTIVTVGFVEDPKLGRHVGLTQSWETSSGPALRNGLAHLLPSLFHDGQFIFDTYQAGAIASDGSWWLSALCPGTNCIVTRNERSGKRLLLRELAAPAPCRFSAVRMSAGRVIGICERDTSEVRQLLGERWDRIAPMLVRGAFRSGDHITLAVRDMRWEFAGPTDPWSPTPLTMDEPFYPLFAKFAGGAALAFDVFTSVAVDDNVGELVIGTRAGFLRWPFTRERGTSVLKKPPQLLWPRIETDGDWQVGRIRRGSDGRLWGKLGSGEIVTVTEKSIDRANPNQWPREITRVGGREIVPDASGVSINGRAITRSNDAWLRTWPLDDITDALMIDDAVWVATRKNGLVKISSKLLQQMLLPRGVTNDPSANELPRYANE